MLNLFLHFLQRRAPWFCAAALVLAAPATRAQSGFGDIIYTVATTTTDTNGRPWAYLLWQATTPGLLSGRTFAVYSKPGDATNNAPYVRLTVVQLQTDAHSIEPLLRRSENIGEKSWQLQQDMMQLFANLMPSNSISRADQLSAVIRGSLVDDGHYRNLVLLARNHPGVALCLGFADAELISTSKTTFEIRNFDLAKNQDVAVVGRVTVDTASPDILPSPGSPVLMPDPSPRGDINLKFRWGTPDTLRRMGLLHFGYNLWRVPKAYAEASSNQWNLSPPLPATLAARSATESNLVKRVNRVPIVPGKLFSMAEASNVTPPTGDTNTMFIADDDGRFRPGYTNYGFTNGARFYYFASARDILGRDGLVSPGTLATVCDRMPPPVPMGIRVVNDYSYDDAAQTNLQALRVIWNQVTNTTDIVSNYWIYRWTSVTQMNALAGNISNNLIAVVPHSANWKTNSFLDVGPSSPTTNNYGQTFWYTVRAGDCAACGQNLSGNSGPAYGVLRKRTGPAAPTAVLDWNCPDPWLDFLGAYTKTVQGPVSNAYNFNVTCVRSNAQFAWAHFVAVHFLYDPQQGGLVIQTNDLGLFTFGLNNLVGTAWSYPTQAIAQTLFYCQAGTYDGKFTQWAVSPMIPNAGLPLPTGQLVMEVDFSARTILNRVNNAKTGRIDGPCRSHEPIDPGTGLITPINICLHPSVGSKEWRLYQRVDDGPLTLYAAGAVTNGTSTICIPGDMVPANPGTICFYGQLFDENDNASPLVRFGCLDIGTADQLPVPLLASISSSGDTNSPGMNLVWFCPPSGLDRFEVWIGVKTGSPAPPLSLSPQLTFSNVFFSQPVTNNSTIASYTFYEYRTPHIGQSFGNGTPQFMVTPTIEIGRPYAVFVKAVGKHGGSGPPSNIETSQWKTTNAPGPQVPWPARPLPSTNTTFGGIAFFLSPTNAFPSLRGPDTGVGVLIGAGVVRGTQNSQQRPIQIDGILDPNTLVATNAAGARLLPMVLYRYQVPNVNFPTVSGDVIQVSPLIEKIAYSTVSNHALLYDPFISITESDFIGWLWVLDTQPQISGATYKYLIVRFGANQEIEEIISTIEVTVP